MEAPPITAIWTPDFNLGYATLSIANHGNSLIQVASRADVYSEDMYHEILLSRQLQLQRQGGKMKVFDDKTIRATIILDHVKQDDLGGSGLQERPIEIGPGETKVIKYFIGDDLMKQNPNHITLILSLNYKDFNKIVATKLNNNWKINEG